jgi:hypothetical protein
MAYFAFHSGMLRSSLAEQGVVPLLVFEWLLSNADETGTVRDVRASRIAHDLSIIDKKLFSVKAVTAALEILQAPDSESFRKEFEGRRIVPVPDSGATYIVVNFKFYNGRWQAERRASKNAERQRRHREKQAEIAAAKQAGADDEDAQSNAPVTHRNGVSRPKAESESESETQSEVEAERIKTSSDAVASGEVSSKDLLQKKPRQRKPKSEPTPEARRLAEQLREHIHRRDPDAKWNPLTSAAAIDKLLKRRTPGVIASVIESQVDGWRYPPILSGALLEKHFDAMHIVMTDGPGKTTPGKGDAKNAKHRIDYSQLDDVRSV